MARSRIAQLHADWIGMLQPEGLVVSVAVLEELEVYTRQDLAVQQALREATPDSTLADLNTLLTGILGWRAKRVREPVDTESVDLLDLELTLRPDRVVVDNKGNTLLFVQWHTGELDRPPPGDRWPASRTERFVRLLHRCATPIGLMATPDHIRLVYAPAGQAPGHLSFPVAALREADGRLLVDALHMLLGTRRVFSSPKGKRLIDVLERSRTEQERVTEKLATQVEDALRLLISGFDDADARTAGTLLSQVDGIDLYDGLITVLLRLVFLLYAEDRGLLPMDHPLYANNYSVHVLADQLTEDAVAHGEAQARRYGAWARLVSLFRMVWSGATHGDLHLPPRQGDLFHPDRHRFLEGRPPTGSHTTDPVRMPPVDDAVVREMLDRLLLLDGQRISYRNLEVEQLGSVYEALMGFSIERASSRALPLKLGGFVEVAVLATAPEPMLTLQDITGERNAKLRKSLPALANWKPTGDQDTDEQTIVDGLDPFIDPRRNTVPPGRHYLQPGESRRKSGSHYTPRSLTEPIVRHTLAPVLGDAPSSDHILGLRICDPAMGSGAFLAEVCRQLADALVAAWAREGTTPADSHDVSLVARRKVSEQCLYGVDKNPRAVQLARLSLWLVTSAPDLPFTFIDHALRQGDALVGLTTQQMAAFEFQPSKKRQVGILDAHMQSAMHSAARARARITARQREMTFARDQYKSNTGWLQQAEDEIWDERRVGDLLIACQWAGGTKTAIKKRTEAFSTHVGQWYPSPDQEPMDDEAEALLAALPMRPFHWWIEFPEVFGRKNPGFDAVVGNPPFGGQNTIREANGGAGYIKLLQALWPHAHGNSDLCAYFFLRAAEVLRKQATFALVASNTIKQGNTLDTGLRHIVNDGDVTLFRAVTDMPWPVKTVAVVVDVVHGILGKWKGATVLNDEVVDGINSSLTQGDELAEPVKLAANAGQCFIGSYVLGKGFVLTPEEAEALIADNPHNATIVRPYIGGRELNNNVPPSPTADVPHDRYVINFGDRTLEEAEQWPELMEIVRRLVKPERDKLKDNPDGRRRKAYWWQFGRSVPGLDAALVHLDRCLMGSQVTKHLLLGLQSSRNTFSHVANVFALNTWHEFAVLQSKPHEHWARAMGSSLEMRLRYTPSTCFETFPFPRPTPAQHTALDATGEALYTLRQRLMFEHQQGMTTIWNRVVDPHEDHPDILALRQARDAMDRAVLDAYGWSDLDPDDSDAIVLRLRKLNTRRAREEAQAAAESRTSR